MSTEVDAENMHVVTLTLWRQLLSYGDSYKASCAKPG